LELELDDDVAESVREALEDDEDSTALGELADAVEVQLEEEQVDELKERLRVADAGSVWIEPAGMDLASSGSLRIADGVPVGAAALVGAVPVGTAMGVVKAGDPVRAADPSYSFSWTGIVSEPAGDFRRAMITLRVGKEAPGDPQLKGFVRELDFEEEKK